MTCPDADGYSRGRERRVADDLIDAAAQLGVRHWRRLDRAGYWAGDVAGDEA
jgi:hypothetical protein